MKATLKDNIRRCFKSECQWVYNNRKLVIVMTVLLIVMAFLLANMGELQPGYDKVFYYTPIIMPCTFWISWIFGACFRIILIAIFATRHGVFVPEASEDYKECIKEGGTIHDCSIFIMLLVLCGSMLIFDWLAKILA